MRAYDVGFGHIDAVPGGAGCKGELASVDEYRSTCWERDICVLFGCCIAERDEADEPSEHGVGELYGAWIELGAHDPYRQPSGGAHGVRAYGVGVGHVGAVSSWSGCDGQSLGGIDSRIACRELDGWLLC